MFVYESLQVVSISWELNCGLDYTYRWKVHIIMRCSPLFILIGLNIVPHPTYCANYLPIQIG